MPRVPNIYSRLPSVDRVLGMAASGCLVEQYGREAVLAAVRSEIDQLRAQMSQPDSLALPDCDISNHVLSRVAYKLAADLAPSVRPVFNLTGTILHTNLGRAVLPEEAAEAAFHACVSAVNLEMDLGSGKRSDRDLHLESTLVRMTGADKATVVNNNAAAVLLVLNALALDAEVLVSRGELIEIGGSFRMPDIMKRAGCRLVEVGTTNRTHLHDYADAIGPRTALIMKVHPSNYEIVGFTNTVAEPALAKLARERGIPLVSDLGAGALLDLRRFGLPYENTPAAMIEAGVDVVTFSADKLLGGPQAGIIVGRSSLMEKINRNPLKRALRLDKIRIAALDAVLRLYSDPGKLTARLPVLRHMSRPTSDIEQQGARLLPSLARALEGRASVVLEPCESQVGSGSLPGNRLPSFAFAIRPAVHPAEQPMKVENLSEWFRALPTPIVGRVHDDTLYLDLRCLEDEALFLSQLELR